MIIEMIQKHNSVYKLLTLIATVHFHWFTTFMAIDFKLI